jgi:hypothetical protein
LYVDDACLTCSVSDADADTETHRANLQQIMDLGNNELSVPSQRIAAKVVEHLLGSGGDDGKRIAAEVVELLLGGATASDGKRIAAMA